MVNGRHFQTDDTTAHDKQFSRHFFQFQRIG
ncbi:Uncharacterised protein [Vibrio cholerae]|nr:Uncharacterised protein [Vibrio cholerae]